VAAGSRPTFVIQRGAGASNDGGDDGARDSYWVVVSRDPTIQEDGSIRSEVDAGGMRPAQTPGTWAWTPADRSASATWWLKTPGTYYWQAYRSDCIQDPDCRVEGPVRRLEVVAAPSPPPPPKPSATAGLTGRPIPRALGRKRNHRSFAVNTARTPAGVDAARFVALVRDSGKRWGNTMTGRTSRQPVRDGESTVGFGPTPSSALGVTTRRDIVKVRQTCTDATARSCRTVEVSRHTGEIDMVLNRRVRWQQGPALPGPRELDLQTVLIHEFGHFSGNDTHAPVGSCQNTPMIAALSPGEYWRSTTQWRLHGCATRLAFGLPAQPVAWRFVHRVETEVICENCEPRGASPERGSDARGGRVALSRPTARR